MRKILVGIILALLTVNTVFTARAAGDATFAIPEKNQGQISLSQTGVLRHNIHAVLLDRRFEYPDRFHWFKDWWRRIAGWLVKIKSSKRALDNRIWGKIFLGLSLVSLIGLLFLLAFGLPKLLAHSGKIKNFGPGDQRRPVADSPGDLKSEAGILAEKGQLREAIRLLYLAGLELLQKNRILPDGSLRLSDKANLQIIQRIFGPNHPGYRAFQELVFVFQEKWFGLRHCQIEEYHRLHEDLKIIEATMGNPHV